MKKYHLIIYVMFFAIGFATLSCKDQKAANAENKEEEILPEDIVELRADQIELAKIELGNFELKSLGKTLKVNGLVTVAPQNFATVCMPLGGFVKSTTLIPGNKVFKGQTLAILENQEYVDIQQAYLETRNKFEYAEAEFKRHTELYKEDVYSQKNVQEVTAQYKSLKAQLRGLEQKLALIGINPATLNADNINSSVAVVSPISGYVQAVNVNTGKFVSPSDVLFEIVNSDELLLELTLFEKDADKTAPGQEIRFYINNETEWHQAIIVQTAKSITSDKTYKVYAKVPDACKNVLPGMYVNALISESDSLVTALPSEAVVSFDDKHYIFIFDNNKEENGKPFTEYRMIEVTITVSENGYTGITLPENLDTSKTRVVIKGAYNLLSAKKNAGEMSC